MDCPVCGNTSSTVWGEVRGFEVLRCDECGLGVTSPFPDQHQRDDINRETYPLEQRIATYRTRQASFTRRYRRQLEDIAAYCPAGQLLDIGCNIGMFLVEARRAGYRVSGVELNPACAEYARNTFDLDVRCSYLEEAGFPSASFDVVTMYDVLEHVPDLPAILSEIRRILKPGGLLVVQSPNLDSLMADMAGSQWSWLSPPDHLYHFTPGSLSRLLVQNGYRVRCLKTWEPADDFCADVMQARLGASLPARVLRKALRLSRMAESAVSLLQVRWWRRQRGALVEAYAVTHGSGGGA